MFNMAVTVKIVDKSVVFLKSYSTFNLVITSDGRRGLFFRLFNVVVVVVVVNT